MLRGPLNRVFVRMYRSASQAPSERIEPKKYEPIGLKVESDPIDIQTINANFEHAKKVFNPEPPKQSKPPKLK